MALIVLSGAGRLSVGHQTGATADEHKPREG